MPPGQLSVFRMPTCANLVMILSLSLLDTGTILIHSSKFQPDEQVSSLTSIRPSYPLCDSPSNRSIPHFHLFRHRGLWKPKSWKTRWNMLLRATPTPRMNWTCTDARISKAANLQCVGGRNQIGAGFSGNACPNVHVSDLARSW